MGKGYSQGEDLVKTEFSNKLVQLIYVSTASETFSADQLPDLLDKCRANNRRAGLTGLLLFSGTSFFQILEGDEKAVDEVYLKIGSDPRHRNLVTILKEPIGNRTFGDWFLRFRAVDSTDIRELGADCDDMLDEMPVLDSRRAERLVMAFEKGNWKEWLREGEPSLSGDVDKISFAFQPIVDTSKGEIFSYEALVRGPNGEPANAVFESILPDKLYEFDFQCRKTALKIAKECGISNCLNLNFIPGAAAVDEFGLDKTLEFASEIGFPQEKIIFEATETEAVVDYPKFVTSVKRGKRYGVELAIDDFGAGYAGLQLLAEFYPDYVKLDMGLVRDVHQSGPRQAVARAIAGLCDELGIDLVIEGVETVEEYEWFRHIGARFFQGYLFAKPLFEGLPRVKMPL